MLTPDDEPQDGPDLVGAVKVGVLAGVLAFMAAMATPTALVRGPDGSRASHGGTVSYEGDFDAQRR